MKSLVELVGYAALQRGADYFEPCKLHWPALDRRAFARGQLACMANPLLHADPSRYGLAARDAGPGLHGQFCTGYEWELADLREVLHGPQGPRRSARINPRP